jgi:SAM-dependent methyltransferase
MGDGTGSGYQLGSDEHELARLDLQGRALAPPRAPSSPRRGSGRACGYWIWAAGREMRLSPPPAWSGRDGRVVGVDRSPQAVARARFRAGQRGLPQVQFAEGDIHDPAPGGPFARPSADWS